MSIMVGLNGDMYLEIARNGVSNLPEVQYALDAEDAASFRPIRSGDKISPVSELVRRFNKHH